jgi:DNA-binding transcriptional LysR family regulator
MKGMNIQHLTAFLAVCQTGSVVAAARQLHLTQPAISKRIQQLEQQLGVVLFDRHQRQLHLTSSGMALQPKAEHILAAVANAERTLSNLEQHVAGNLAFAASHHMGLYYLPELLSRFIQTYPEVQLEPQFMASERVYEAVQQRQFELGFGTLFPQPPKGIQQVVLGIDRLVYVAAPQHPLAQRQRLTLNELVATRAVLPVAESATFALIEQQFHQRQLKLPSILPINYLEKIRMMVSVGLGWSVLPASMVDARLHILSVDAPPLQRKLGLMYLQQRTLSNPALSMCAMAQHGHEHTL